MVRTVVIGKTHDNQYRGSLFTIQADGNNPKRVVEDLMYLTNYGPVEPNERISIDEYKVAIRFVYENKTWVGIPGRQATSDFCEIPQGKDIILPEPWDPQD